MSVEVVLASGNVSGTGVVIVRQFGGYVLRWEDGDERPITAEDAALMAEAFSRLV
jgi:hypothetical protein